MKTLIYFILGLVGLIGTITGTIKLCSYGLNVENVIQIFFMTFVCMCLFVFFGYAFMKHYKELIRKTKKVRTKGLRLIYKKDVH